MRIAKAIRHKRYGQAKVLQWLLTHSHSAKLLAVKRVSENAGRHTPGIDGKVWRTDAQKMDAVVHLRRPNYKTQPLRRTYITKKNGKLRPLNIPTMSDRAHQALHTLGLQPVAETEADKNSYGFREGRSCADAIGQCFNVLAKSYAPVWILEGDIKSCFDEISHAWLLDHILMDRSTLRQWLKAGFVENQRLFATTAGTPQGGIASPVLANLTLDGLEAVIRASIKPRRDKVNFIRYADDFVVTAARRETLEEIVKPVIVGFLKERGLRLSEEKTAITHIQEGFNFLGQRIRKYGNKLLITPSRQSVRSVLGKARELIRSNRGLPPEVLIRKLSPILRGWAQYHRNVVSKKTYARVDYYLHKMLWRWAAREHPNKPCGWIRRHHFSADEKGSFSTTVTTREDRDRVLKIYRMSHTVIERHIKVRGEANPYQPESMEYFQKRRFFAWRTYPLGSPRALSDGKDKNASQHSKTQKPDCRITSAEADLR